MGPTLLTDVFTACFWFGAAATVVGFALGVGHHGPFHLPGIGHAPAHLGGLSGAAPSFSPMNLNSILVFLTVFGAVGLIAESGLGALLAVALALVAGTIAAWLVFLFVARFLARGQTYLADEPIVGTIGKVSKSIGSGRVGEILYTRHDVRHSDGARSLDGTPIAPGEEVVIVGYNRGIATVQRWHEFVGEPLKVQQPEQPLRDIVRMDKDVGG